MPDADPPIWMPKVVKRKHPFGEDGVRSSLEEVAKKSALGAVDPRMRAWAIECLERARQNGEIVSNPRGRAIVLLRAVQTKLWVPDPVGSEFIAGAHLTACVDKDAPCFHGGDCFPEGTLVLGEGHELKPIESLKAGEKIWGLDRWSEVEAVQYKGILPIDVITLNNGSEVKLTGDHHVYVLECPEHPDGHRKVKGRCSCSCAIETRVEKKIRVSDLEEGMVLPQPKRLPFGENKHPDAPSGHEQAYVEGLHAADGCADFAKNRYFSIAGQDGCPKEQQKREVQKICEGFGIVTNWARKEIRVSSKEWTLRVQRMGHLAPNKHFLTLDLDEANAAASLRGVMADSGANTRGPGRTFTTTSRLLAVQTRVLHRMFGIACGWRYIENHGGLGQHPIWRLGTRGNSRVDGRKPWLLRVRKIEREVISVPCWDIQTDDHRVYLPEHDVTVLNCDDLASMLAAAFSSVGLYTMIVGHSYDMSRSIGHVLCSVWVDGRWHYADPSTKLPLGQCTTPVTRERCLSFPNIKVICDEDACLKSPSRFDPERNHFVEQGTFVGVDGPPRLSRVQWLSGVEWLGQGDSFSVQMYEAAEERNFGTSNDDLRFYGATAGYAGGTAACAATGAGAAVAPICGEVGAKIGEFVINIFVDDKEDRLQEIYKQESATFDATIAKFVSQTAVAEQWFRQFEIWDKYVNASLADLEAATGAKLGRITRQRLGAYGGSENWSGSIHGGGSWPSGEFERYLEFLKAKAPSNAGIAYALSGKQEFGAINERIDEYITAPIFNLVAGKDPVPTAQTITTNELQVVSDRRISFNKIATSGFQISSAINVYRQRQAKMFEISSAALTYAVSNEIAEKAAREVGEPPPASRPRSPIVPVLGVAAAGAALWWAYTTL